MDGVFSIDDISDGFWSPHSPPISLHGDADVAQPSSAAGGMNRSSSEWAFQRFLEEAVSPHHTTAATTTTTTFPIDDAAKIKLNHHHHHRNDNQPPPPPPPPKNIPTDPEEYQALLKRRLEMACAAVALTRASNNGKATELAAAAAEIGSNSSSTTANGRDSSKTQLADSGAKIDTPPIPAISRKSAIQVRSTTSGSSGDQSDDDEAEGETEDFQNIDPTDKKRMKRMLSNRESARRSRRRKQAHLTERETHVSQLRVENSSLLKRLSDINQKYNESAVDNRVLKADVETLRAKVKMAEESVKRVTGLSSLLHTIPSLPIQDDPTQQIYHPLPNNRLTNDQTIRNEIRGASASGNRGDGEK